MSPSLAEARPAPARARGATRARLIGAAVRLFQERGFHGVGTAEILTAANAPRGSLYHHFPGGKTELACAAAGWLTDEVIAALQRLRLDGLEPPAVVEALARSTADWLRATDYRQSGLLPALVAGLGAADAALGAAVAEAYARLEAEQARMLAVWGLPRARAREEARALIVATDGALVLARARRDAAIVVEQAARLAAGLRRARR